MGRETEAYRRRRRMALSSLPNIILTILVCLTCWLVSYQYSTDNPVNGGLEAMPLWESICRILPTKWLIYIVGLFLICLLSFLIQRINYTFVVVRGKRLLPFLFFLLFVSTNPELLPVRPASVALFFLVGALYELFRSYQKPEATGRAFNISVYLSLGSLLWPHLIWMIPLFWFGMYKLRSLTARSLLTSLLGALTTFGFVLAWCFWQNDYTVFTILLRQLTNINFVLIKNPLQIEWLSSLCVISLMIITYVYILLHEFENIIRTRQYLSFLVVFGFYSLVLLGLYQQDSANMLCLFYVPASMLISYFFSDRRNLLTYLFYILIVVFLVLLLLVRLWTF